MLYLLRTYTKDGSMLKIGYADNYKNRYFQYESHNPGIEEVKTREGDLFDETILHIYLHFLGYGAYKDEWYKDCHEVIDKFDEDIDRVKEHIWENRALIFKGRLTNSLSTLLLYDQLSNEFSKSDEECLGIDNEFKKIDSRKREADLKNRLSSISDRDLSVVEREVMNILNIDFFDNRICYIYSLNLSSDLMQKVLDMLPDQDYSKYYWSIVPSRAKALKYRRGNLEAEYNLLKNVDSASPLIFDAFVVGQKYSKSNAKSMLQKIYDSLSLRKTAKASDLSDYFDISECKVVNQESGKRDAGFEIIRKKD